MRATPYSATRSGAAIRGRVGRVARVATAMAAVVALAATGCGADDSADAGDDQVLGGTVVDANGTSRDLAEFVGRPLVVNFFAESCAPCVAEMPAFEAVHVEVGPDIAFLGVSEDATEAAARRIVETTGITYPTVWDADGTALTRFRAPGLPTTLIVDPDGEVLVRHTGEMSADELRAMLAEHVPET